MLAYVLALVVGLGSFALYMAAFFFPEVHRKNDFVWSGLGLFYALVLWVCAGQIRGGLLLGQIAGVALLGWFGWQLLILRRQVVPLEEQTTAPSPEELKGMLSNLAKPETLSTLAGQASDQFGKLANRIQTLTDSVGKPREEVRLKLDEPYVPLTPADFASARRNPVASDEMEEALAEAIAPPTNAIPTYEDDLGDAFEALTEHTSQRVQDASETVSQTASNLASEVGETASAFTKASTPEETEPLPGLKEKVVSVFALVTGTVQGLFKPKENKPIYVRKQFRTDIDETAAAPDDVTVIEAELMSAADAAQAANDPAIADVLVEESPGTVNTLLTTEPAQEEAIAPEEIDLETFFDSPAAAENPPAVDSPLQVEPEPAIDFSLDSVIAEESTIPPENLFGEPTKAIPDFSLNLESESLESESVDAPTPDLDVLFQEPTSSTSKPDLDLPLNSFESTATFDLGPVPNTFPELDLDLSPDSPESPESTALDVDALLQDSPAMPDVNPEASSEFAEAVSQDIDAFFQETSEASPELNLGTPLNPIEETPPEISALFQEQAEMDLKIDDPAFDLTEETAPEISNLLSDPLQATVDDELGLNITEDAPPEINLLEQEPSDIDFGSDDSVTSEIAETPLELGDLLQEPSDIDFGSDDSASSEIAEPPLDLSDLVQEPSDIGFNLEEAVLSEAETIPVESEARSPELSETTFSDELAFDLIEESVPEIDDLFQEQSEVPSNADEFSPFGAEEAGLEMDSLFQEQPEAALNGDDEPSPAVEEVANYVDSLFQEQLNSDSTDLPPISLNLDAIFQEPPDATLPTGLDAFPETSSSGEAALPIDLEQSLEGENPLPDIDFTDLLGETSEPPAESSLGNPFAEAVAGATLFEQPGAETTPADDFDLAAMLQPEDALVESTSTETVELQFEPEGTIDLNNLEGLFDDNAPIDSAFDVDELFPENEENLDIRLEEAFKDPNGAIADADADEHHPKL